MSRRSHVPPWIRCVGAGGLGFLTGALVERVYRSMRPWRHVIEQQPKGLPAPGGEAFARLLAHVVRDPRSDGNRLAVHNGTKGYLEAMLSLLKTAERSIWMEMFWWEAGRFSDAVIDRLEEAAEAGVDVRLVVDGVGADAIRTERFERMREAGVQVAVHHPVRPWTIRKMNHRTHRRILVADGKVALTGGVGIGDEWLGIDGEPPWADLLLEIQGPAALDLAALFADHWRLVTGQPLVESGLFVDDEHPGEASVQLLSGGPEDEAQHMRTALLVAIAAARQRLRAVSPYFVPDDLVLEALTEAAQRGVDVEVILPGDHIDVPIIRRASRSLWGPLLDAGVRILEFQPTMLHSKVLVVDDAWTMVGSMNLDERSFRLNAEVAVATEDPETVRAMTERLDGYAARSRPVSFDEWRHRPVTRRAADKMACTLRSQL